MKKLIAITLSLMLILMPLCNIMASDDTQGEETPTVTSDGQQDETVTDNGSEETGTTSVEDGIEEDPVDNSDEEQTEDVSELVAIGGDLTAAQKKKVYSYFGIEQGSVGEIVVTHADEAQYLANVAADKIGTKSISSVYVKQMEEGSGIDIQLYNINWLTSVIYENALDTVGIKDAKIVIASPFEVSGTAALTGIYKAYEDVTGEKLDENAKEAATQELVTTGEISDSVGSDDAASFVNDIKLALKNGELSTSASDSEILSKVNGIASDYGITLTEDQQDKVVKLVKALDGVDLSAIEEIGLWDQIMKFLTGLFN